MNVAEINPGTLGSLGHYFAAAVPLTVLTIWVFVAYQGDWSTGGRPGSGTGALMLRFMWPYLYAKRYIKSRWRRATAPSDKTIV